jgi:glycine cleavage system aminomethyltransferase T
MTTTTPLLKHSPLSGIYRQYPVSLSNYQGWQMADHFGHPAQEQRHLAQESVLADWSHLGKLSLSGQQASQDMERLWPGAGAIAPLHSLRSEAGAILRLTPNDYLLLTLPGTEQTWLSQIDQTRVTTIDQTGAMGCFVLAGPRRDEVLERSTAMDLRRDRLLPGGVIQTTIHTIRCTLYLKEQAEMILHPRSLSESLFTALLDVGMGVGLVPAGLQTMPVLQV